MGLSRVFFGARRRELLTLLDPPAEIISELVCKRIAAAEV
jgi:hypothetical protein